MVDIVIVPFCNQNEEYQCFVCKKNVRLGDLGKKIMIRGSSPETLVNESGYRICYSEECTKNVYKRPWRTEIEKSNMIIEREAAEVL